MTNQKLIEEYVSARDKAAYWQKERATKREALLMQLRLNHGRLISRSGVALIKRGKRTHASVKTIRNLIMLGRLKEDDIQPALEVTEFDQVIAHGTPDSLPWVDGDEVDNGI